MKAEDIRDSFRERNSRIVDGRAWTENDSRLVTDMPKDEQAKVMTWIRENIIPRNTPIFTKSSYGLKHVLERDIGIYMTNNQFKDAMLLSGFYPVDERRMNWCYCISKRSPALRT